MSKQKEVKADAINTSRRNVEKHMQCPRCYGGQLNGVGKVYSTQGRTQYRKCDQCGHTWVTIIKEETTIIRNRDIEIVERTA